MTSPISPPDGPVKMERLTGPLVFFADVNGNLEALDAVVAACREKGASGYFAAGDLLYRGDQPLEVWKRLGEIGAHLTRGTTDLALCAVDPDKLTPKNEHERAAAERFRWTREALGELILARLRRLPAMLRVELSDGTEIAVTHGSPADPTEPLTHDLTEDEVSALLGTDPADVVISGGSQVPYVREVSGVTVVGVGSVGGPERVAYYTLVEPGVGGPHIENCWVKY